MVVAALEDVKAQDIAVLDVRDQTTVTDYMVVASGTSNRHVKALADAVAEKSREAGHRPVGIEGAAGSEWVLLDLQDTLVHVIAAEGARVLQPREALVSTAGRRCRGD